MKKELVSFNEVVRDISSLTELSDEGLETVAGGKAASAQACPTVLLPGSAVADLRGN